MTPHDLIIAPFNDPAMRKAIAACIALSVGATPLGIFMVLRRMALVGDAMSHAILPGVAIAFLVSGMALGPMLLGSFAAGVAVALAAALLMKLTQLKEDASFTISYLISIAIGVLVFSLKGADEELMHTLFGDALNMSGDALLLITAISSVTLGVLALLYRGLVIECFDPDFLKAARRGGGWIAPVFFVLVVLNLVSAFQALGTFMALGLILLPAIAAKFWTQKIDTALPLSIGIAAVSSFIGLLISYHAKLPSGPPVILTAAGFCVLSILLGRHGSLYTYVFNKD